LLIALLAVLSCGGVLCTATSAVPAPADLDDVSVAVVLAGSVAAIRATARRREPSPARPRLVRRARATRSPAPALRTAPRLLRSGTTEWCGPPLARAVHLLGALGLGVG
jgi:hypothetical protein